MICLFLLFLAFVCYLWILIAIYVKTQKEELRQFSEKASVALASLCAGYLSCFSFR